MLLDGIFTYMWIICTEKNRYIFYTWTQNNKNGFCFRLSTLSIWTFLHVFQVSVKHSWCPAIGRTFSDCDQKLQQLNQLGDLKVLWKITGLDYPDVMTTAPYVFDIFLGPKSPSAKLIKILDELYIHAVFVFFSK